MLVALAVVPFRSSLGLGGFLICTLLVVGLDALAAGVRPALFAVVVGVLAGAYFFAPPYGSFKADVPVDFVSQVAFVVVGSAIAVLVGQLAGLVEQQAALRRVATLAARAAPAEELFASVTEEVGQLLPADFARMARCEPDETVSFVAGWSRTDEDFLHGARWTAMGENISSSVLRTGRAARIDRSAVGAPIIVEGRMWGALVAGSVGERRLAGDAQARLASFTDLLATAVGNAESRAALTRLAEEQTALRRVATLVARAAPAGELFAAVSEEVGKLIGADQTLMCRYESDDTATVLSGWSRTGYVIPTGNRPALGGKNLLSIVAQTRRSARMESYAEGSGEIEMAARDAGVASGVATPILVEDRLWGIMITVSMDEPLPPDTEARLASFTELVVTAIANAENRSDLHASRARLVAASDEARRRIERDLHDGAQQRLVSLGLELRAAQAALPPQLGDLEGELSNVALGLTSVLDELREIARGIHPAILAEGGLGPAVRTLARRCPVPVEIDIRAGARLPERVEVAAYYVVSETLTNAAKHAHASIVHVEVEALDSLLRLSVTDDGEGGADAARGSGLVGLKDRVEALGGTITIRSPVGSGTVLKAELPLED
jgi:signal transduction histidine kinase